MDEIQEPEGEVEETVEVEEAPETSETPEVEEPTPILLAMWCTLVFTVFLATRVLRNQRID